MNGCTKSANPCYLHACNAKDGRSLHAQTSFVSGYILNNFTYRKVSKILAMKNCAALAATVASK